MSCLSWFEELDAGERCAASAIVDDAAFVAFFLALSEQEQHTNAESGNGNNGHALFSKEYLTQQYALAKQVSRKVAVAPSSLLSSPLSSSSRLTSMGQGGTPPSDEEGLVSFLKGRGKHELMEEVHANDIFCYVSGIGSHVKAAGAAAGPKVALPTAKDEPQLFRLASTLQGFVGLSFATSGSETFDGLFLLRPLTDDAGRLVGLLRELSHGGMFADPQPTEDEVKDALRCNGSSSHSDRGGNSSGCGFPSTQWLSRALENPHANVPYYAVLLARMELSIYSAYYASLRSRCSSGIGALRKRRSVFAPSWETLAGDSTLSHLSSSAVMVSLACLAEEARVAWQTLPLNSQLQTMRALPTPMRNFYSGGAQGDTGNNDGRRYKVRSDSVIDRLLLYPLEWLLDDVPTSSGVAAATTAARLSHVFRFVEGSSVPSSALHRADMAPEARPEISGDGGLGNGNNWRLGSEAPSWLQEVEEQSRGGLRMLRGDGTDAAAVRRERGSDARTGAQRAEERAASIATPSNRRTAGLGLGLVRRKVKQQDDEKEVTPAAPAHAIAPDRVHAAVASSNDEATVSVPASTGEHMQRSPGGYPLAEAASSTAVNEAAPAGGDDNQASSSGPAATKSKKKKKAKAKARGSSGTSSSSVSVAQTSKAAIVVDDDEWDDWTADAQVPQKILTQRTQKVAPTPIHKHVPSPVSAAENGCTERSNGESEEPLSPALARVEEDRLFGLRLQREEALMLPESREQDSGSDGTSFQVVSKRGKQGRGLTAPHSDECVTDKDAAPHRIGNGNGSKGPPGNAPTGAPDAVRPLAFAETRPAEKDKAGPTEDALSWSGSGPGTSPPSPAPPGSPWKAAMDEGIAGESKATKPAPTSFSSGGGGGNFGGRGGGSGQLEISTSTSTASSSVPGDDQHSQMSHARGLNELSVLTRCSPFSVAATFCDDLGAGAESTPAAPVSRETAWVRSQKSLSESVRAFTRAVSASHRMGVHRMARVALLLEVRAAAEALWPYAAVHIFGSSATDLALPTSDIDIVVQLCPPPAHGTTMPHHLPPIVFAPPLPVPLPMPIPGVPAATQLMMPLNMVPQGFVVPDIAAAMAVGAAHPSHEAAVVNCADEDGDIDTNGVGAGVPALLPPLPMFVPMPMPTPMDMFNSVFEGLTRQLCMHPWSSEVNPIPTASVPVIKLRAAADVLLTGADMQQAATAAHHRQLFDRGVPPGAAWSPPAGSLLTRGAEEADGSDEPVLYASKGVPPLPFHVARGDSVAVDITIDCCGLRGHGFLPWLGDRADRFVLGCLHTRSHTLAAVVRVVKALLSAPDVALHVPFKGGMSSFSVFLMTLASYDRCVHREMYRARCSRTTAAENGSAVGAAMQAVTEGDVLLHTLQLFSVGFDPARQGIDVRADPGLGAHDDLAPTSLFLFDLTPEQQITVAGGGVWIADPLEPVRSTDFGGIGGAALATRTGPTSTSNVARPSFAYRQVQRYFLRCLLDIEKKCDAPDTELLPLRFKDFI